LTISARSRHGGGAGFFFHQKQGETTMTEEFKIPFKLFDLGRVLATPGAIAACPPERMQACLREHVLCNWDHCTPEGHKANFDALFSGERIFSIHPIDPARACTGNNRLWIITEADRSATTFLLPSEY
jgi:hypothetical protein